MSVKNASGNKFRTAMFAISGITLVWLVISKSLVAYLAQTAPETARALQSDNPTVLLDLADKKIKERVRRLNENPVKFSDGFSTDKVLDKKIRRWLEKVLRKEPLNAQALRILGQLADMEADKDRAEQLMLAAVRLSKRETIAVYWLAQRSYEKKEYARAVDYVDILLRAHPKLRKHIIPLLVKIAETKKGQVRLEKHLATNPRWRARFFQLLKAGERDVRLPLRLFLSLKNTKTPPTTSELRYYLIPLIARKEYDLAYYTWLQFLSIKQLESAGMLFNGSFESDADGLPFNWEISNKSDVLIKLTSLPDEGAERALSIRFGYGRVKPEITKQITVLSPGQYHLTGLFKGRFKGKRGLQWIISCASGRHLGKKLAEGPMFIGMEKKWKQFDIAFQVPAENCPAQYVSLSLDARTASEQLVSGHVWYDRLSLSRTSNTF